MGVEPVDCGSRKFQLGENDYAEIRFTLEFGYEAVRLRACAGTWIGDQ